MAKANRNSWGIKNYKNFRAFYLSVLFLFLGPIAFAQSAPETSSPPPEDETRTLDEVTVEGQQFEKARPLPTGEIELSPELITSVNGEGGRAAIHVHYEFIFDPVIVNDQGEVFLDPDRRRKRETLAIMHLATPIAKHRTER